MAQQIICDRCGNPVSLHDERALDDLRLKWQKDICANCDLEIELAGEVTRQAFLHKVQAGEYLLQWLARYEG